MQRAFVLRCRFTTTALLRQSSKCCSSSIYPILLSLRSVARSLNSLSQPSLPHHTGSTRLFSKSSSKSEETPREAEIRKIIETSINTTYANVEDISGGCGAMYRIYCVSQEFVGIPLVKQHRMVTEALQNVIPDMHGLTITTRRPDQFEKDKKQAQ